VSMHESDLARRLEAVAPTGPNPALRQRVLAAATVELGRPVHGLDRLLARKLPWIVGLLTLTGLALWIGLQEAAAGRLRAERREVAPPRERSQERAVTELAGMDGEPAAAGSLGRRPPGATGPLFGPRDVRRWLEDPRRGDFR